MIFSARYLIDLSRFFTPWGLLLGCEGAWGFAVVGDNRIGEHHLQVLVQVFVNNLIDARIFVAVFQEECYAVVRGCWATISGAVGAEPIGNCLQLALEACADFLLLYGSRTLKLVDALCKVNIVAALLVAKYSFELPPPNLPEMPLMMSMGVIFAMIVVFFRLVMAPKWRLCSFGMISEFLRNRFTPKWSVF